MAKNPFDPTIPINLEHDFKVADGVTIKPDVSFSVAPMADDPIGNKFSATVEAEFDF